MPVLLTTFALFWFNSNTRTTPDISLSRNEWSWRHGLNQNDSVVCQSISWKIDFKKKKSNDELFFSILFLIYFFFHLFNVIFVCGEYTILLDFVMILK